MAPPCMEVKQLTQLEHALQCAELARKNGATDERSRASCTCCTATKSFAILGDKGIDDLHELLGEKFLGQHFKLAAVQPVKLHVQAKRYLCATEEGYYEALSNSSKVSLEFQGGIMSPSEMEVFEKNEFYNEAVALRRWDDLAKDPNLVSPPISTFVPSIELALK